MTFIFCFSTAKLNKDKISYKYTSSMKPGTRFGIPFSSCLQEAKKY